MRADADNRFDVQSVLEGFVAAAQEFDGALVVQDVHGFVDQLLVEGREKWDEILSFGL